MISKFSVKKPYTVLVAVLLVIVLGVVSLTRMTTDLLPDMSLQYALIITTDIGASPEKVEMEVTAPIEAAMATTTGIKNVGSMSYNSYSIVTCEYEQSVSMDSVVIEIQQSLDQLSGYWGDNVGTPMIMQINPDMLPIMTAAVDVESMGALNLANYVENDLTPALESLEGVASVSSVGQLEEKVVITLDQTKIDAINSLVQKEIKGEFTDAEKEISDAQAEIADGKAAMEEAPDQLSEAFDQVMEGKDQVDEIAGELTTQLSTLKEQRSQLNKMLTIVGPILDLYEQTNAEYAEAKGSLEPKKVQLQELEKAIAALEAEIGNSGGTEEEIPSEGTTEGETDGAETENPEIQLTEKEQELLTLKAQKVALEAEVAVLEKAFEAADAAKQAVDAELVKYAAQLNETGMMKIESAEDFAKIKPTLESIIKQMDAGIEQLEDAVKLVTEQQIALPEALDTINLEAAKAAMQLAPASAELAVASASLEQAKTALEEAKETALDSADMTGILTIETLSGLIVAQNFDMPAGYAYDDDTQYLVRVGEAVKSIDELENLVLMDMGMDSVGLIRICDVANVEVLDNSDESYAIINGNPGIVLTFEKQTGYSTGEVTDRILDKFDSLEKQNDGLHFTVLMDQGVYIDMIVNSVMENMIIGAILAILVLIVFLKDWRPTIVIAVSIPLSVITAIVLMYFTDISLNIISMSGLMLGIGMLVDNSIVVIENIYRLRNEGLSIRKACVEGSDQVAGAIIASTLTTVSVYIPIIFTDGITRQLFVDLALTIAFTLLASLIVALTVVPAMSSFTLRTTKDVKTPWFDKLSQGYGKFLEKCLSKRALVLIVTLVLLVVSAGACLSKGMTFMDMDMETGQLTVTVGPQEGEIYTFEELTDYTNEVVERISDIEGIETIGATAGGSSTMSLMSGGSDTATMYILLEENTDVTAAQISEEIAERTKDMACLVESSSGSSDFSAYFGSGLSIKIKGSDLDTLQEIAAEVAKIVEETEGTTDVEDGLDDTTPQWTINVDKEKAAEYGLTVAQVFQLVYAEMASSTSATTISTDIKDYEVYLQTEGQSELQLGDIKSLTYTYTDKEGEEKEIPLTDFCTMEETTTLSTIYRDAQTRYVTVSCAIDDDHNVTLVSDAVQEKLDAMEIPEGYSVEMAGEDETINEAMSQLVLMAVLAIIFIYLIMVAQFQSLKSPFIILFTIPLACTGGFLALFFTGKELSVIAMLGFIMLAGVIVNNGIVLIDYINQARKEGKSKKDAIIEAGITRLRPILMTALTTILAMLPSAFGMGEGSVMMQPMSITMVGGLTYGTLLTLFVIPCVYDLFNKEKSMVEEEL
ncbi:MAG: efflux RND transporter permease subunit [Lachnospiraceae bacterium]|nr:efflux RND transporter permease subunit [Lachnospiraceae bacterium]